MAQESFYTPLILTFSPSKGEGTFTIAVFSVFSVFRVFRGFRGNSFVVLYFFSIIRNSSLRACSEMRIS